MGSAHKTDGHFLGLRAIRWELLEGKEFSTEHPQEISCSDFIRSRQAEFFGQATPMLTPPVYLLIMVCTFSRRGKIPPRMTTPPPPFFKTGSQLSEKHGPTQPTSKAPESRSIRELIKTRNTRKVLPSMKSLPRTEIYPTTTTKR